MAHTQGRSRPGRTWWLLVWFAALAGTGCAALQRTEEPDPDDVLARGLAALEQADYRTAFDHLVWVYTNHWTEPIGQRALLALVAAEMDPRNPSRRLDVGSELAESLLNRPDLAAWTEPVTETLYLLAQELGAAEQRLARAEARERAATERARQAEVEAREARAEARQAQRAAAQAARRRPLPQLTGPTVPERMRRVEHQRALAEGQAEHYRNRVEQLERRLAERERELARVRRTVRP